MPSFHDGGFENAIRHFLESHAVIISLRFRPEAFLFASVDFTVHIFCAKISLVNIPLLPTFLPKLPVKAWEETRRFEKIRKSPLTFRRWNGRKCKDLRRNPVLLRRFIRWLKSYLFATARFEPRKICQAMQHETTVCKVFDPFVLLTCNFWRKSHFAPNMTWNSTAAYIVGGWICYTMTGDKKIRQPESTAL